MITPVNAMTVDVEDYFHVSAFSDTVSRSDWDNKEARVVHNTERLLTIFESYGISATFFVLGWVAERFPKLIEEISRSGHEIASHGYSHKLVFNQSVNEFRDETIRSKKILEDITGQPILGYRAASYSITRRSLWAIDVLAEAGFTYDSSIFPVRHDRYGIPGAPRHPFRIMTTAGNELTEFPLSTARFLGFRMPVAGGGYFRLMPYGMTKFGLRRITETELRPFIFYLHPWEIDEHQPKISAGWLSTYRHYTNIERCESRLIQLLNDFSFAPVRDVLADLEHGPLTIPTITNL